MVATVFLVELLALVLPVSLRIIVTVKGDRSSSILETKATHPSDVAKIGYVSNQIILISSSIWTERNETIRNEKAASSGPDNL